jgi:stress response protein YsnF
MSAELRRFGQVCFAQSLSAATFIPEKGTKMRDAPDEKELVVPLASEELRVEKRETSSGKVRVQTLVETADELARATVEEESLDVQRVPVGKVAPWYSN